MDVGMSKGVLNARPQVIHSGFPAQCQLSANLSVFILLQTYVQVCQKVLLLQIP